MAHRKWKEAKQLVSYGLMVAGFCLCDVRYLLLSLLEVLLWLKEKRKKPPSIYPMLFASPMTGSKDKRSRQTLMTKRPKILTTVIFG